MARVPQREQQILSKEESERLMDAAKNPRDHALVGLMLYMGLHVGEVISLEMDDIDLRNGFIYGVGRGKYANFLPIPKKLKKILVCAIKTRPREADNHHSYLFCNSRSPAEHMSREMAWRTVSSYGQAVLGRDISPNLLRRTYVETPSDMEEMRRTLNSLDTRPFWKKKLQGRIRTRLGRRKMLEMYGQS